MNFLPSCWRRHENRQDSPRLGDFVPCLSEYNRGCVVQATSDRSRSQLRYYGTEQANRGAVVISINDRLGGLPGFFVHPALTAESKPDKPPSKYCLLDLIAALR